MAPKVGHHFEMNIKMEIIKLNLFLTNMHTNNYLTKFNLIFVYYVNNILYSIYRGLGPGKVCLNDDPGLTLTYFTARSNSLPNALYGKYLNTRFYRNF